MNSEKNEADDFSSESELNLLIAAYLDEVQQGNTPLQSEWLNKHPKWAPELSRFFANLSPVKRALARMPQRIGEYELIEEHPEGGMGIVYKAKHPDHGLVALKLIRPDRLIGSNAKSRFWHEFKIAKHLDHPNIVKLKDFYSEVEHDYFTMEYIAGGSLAEASRNLTPEWSAQLVAKIARAVGYAHRQGIIHRDLKPANVLLTIEKEPKIADFGLAKDLNNRRDTFTTASDVVLGTAMYLSPEQARNKEVGPPADIHGLGCILYFLLTGKSPFDSGSRIDILNHVAWFKPPPPSAYNPHVSGDLDAICQKCLAKKTGDRYDNAERLAEDLERCVRGESIAIRPPGWLRNSFDRVVLSLEVVLHNVKLLWYEPRRFWRERKSQDFDDVDLTDQQRLLGNWKWAQLLLPLSVVLSLGFAEISTLCVGNSISWGGWLAAWFGSVAIGAVVAIATFAIGKVVLGVEFGVTFGQAIAGTLATIWSGMAGAGHSGSLELASAVAGFTGAVISGGIEVGGKKWKGVAIGLAIGLIWGSVFGVATYVGSLRGVFSFFDLQSPNALHVGMAFATTFWLTYFRLVVYPWRVLQVLRLYRQATKAQQLDVKLWRQCPVAWDDVIWLPLPLFCELLFMIANHDPTEGERRFDFVINERPLNAAAARKARLRAQECGERSKHTGAET
jgi:serine/threonine protein kinase